MLLLRLRRARARSAQEPGAILAHGLDRGAGPPQDTVRAIAQTPDGYLWLATDEGLARYDGYEFVVFDKASGGLPANSITSLAAGAEVRFGSGPPRDWHG